MFDSEIYIKKQTQKKVFTDFFRSCVIPVMNFAVNNMRIRPYIVTILNTLIFRVNLFKGAVD